MGVEKEAGEFSLESRGLSVSEPSSTGGGSITVDYEGTATGYGFVASTVPEAGAKEGTTTASRWWRRKNIQKMCEHLLMLRDLQKQLAPE
jgi:hypothetical protein